VRSGGCPTRVGGSGPGRGWSGNVRGAGRVALLAVTGGGAGSKPAGPGAAMPGTGISQRQQIANQVISTLGSRRSRLAGAALCSAPASLGCFVVRVSLRRPCLLVLGRAARCGAWRSLCGRGVEPLLAGRRLPDGIRLARSRDVHSGSKSSVYTTGCQQIPL
jgi:hypothetical protein